MKVDGPKRRRLEDENACKSGFKRAATGSRALPAGTATKHANVRAQVRHMFEFYQAVERGMQAGGRSAAFEAAFEAVISTAGINLATQRLAARVIARFLYLFPQCTDAAATALISVYQAKPSSHIAGTALLAATKADALNGLCSVVSVAQKQGERAVQTALRVADFSLKLLHAHALQQTASQHIQPSLVFCLSPAPILTRLLLATFKTFPRVTIKLALQALTKSQDKVMSLAALWLFTHELLAPSTSLADSQGGQGSPVVVGGKVSCTTSPETSINQTNLAARVLLDLPDTQAWLRSTLQAVSKDKGLLISKEARGVLQELSKLAAPAVPAAAPAAAPACIPLPLSACLGSKTAQETNDVSPPLPPLVPLSPSALPAPSDIRLKPSPPLPSANVGGLPSLPPPPSPPKISTPVLHTPLAAKGGPITVADCCLALSGLPASATSKAIKAQCELFGAVDSVHLGPSQSLGPGEVFVVFKSLRDAAMCYEQLAGQASWGSNTPIRCEFSPGLPWECPMRAREGSRRVASKYVWCAAVAPPEALVTVIENANLPCPNTLLQVAGKAPGFLLDMPDPTCCQAVVEVLMSRFLPGTPVTSLIMFSTVASTTPADVSSPTFSKLTVPHAHGHGLHIHKATPQKRFSNTVLVGHIHDSVSEETLLDAFRRFGEVASHRLTRQNRSAVFEFKTPEAAAEAQKIMNGSKLGSHALRVEWKHETSCKSNSGQPHSGRVHHHPPAHSIGPNSVSVPAASSTHQRQHRALSPHAQPTSADGVMWQGVIAKSGVTQCEVYCAKAEACLGQGATEPQGWPETLDVRHRMDIGSLMGKMWQSAPTQSRAAHVLLPWPGGRHHHQRVAEFSKYLLEKSRAGVVNLDNKRTLYIVPPSTSNANKLGLAWDSKREPATLFAVVIPTTNK